MGLFGGSKSSKNETNISQSAGFSEIAGPVNSVNASGGSTVFMTSTDHGSVGRAFGTAEKALDQMRLTTSGAISAVSQANRDSLNFSQTNLDSVLNFAREANSKAQGAVQTNVEHFTNKFSEFANRQTNTNDQRMTDVTKWAIGAAVVVVGFNAWRGRKA